MGYGACIFPLSFDGVLSLYSQEESGRMRIGEIACAHLSVHLPPFAFADLVAYEGVSRAMFRIISVIAVVECGRGIFPTWNRPQNFEGGGTQRSGLALLNPVLAN